ncbi:putative pectinesterase 11 [Amaranthus tricolor]|uniref:putative pectinesterase 11 n=1 Tax=Amaranthus tricolor TaxID=29722 RepID=UPI00258B4D6E|nr:putative pectinesterase 11 [Amaranthus tricolor]
MENHRLMLVFVVMVSCSELARMANGREEDNDEHLMMMYWKRIMIVDESGKTGDFKKIQDAIDAVPSNNVDPTFIRVEPGIYKEKVTVPQDKPFITLSGRNASSTVITWNDGSDIFKSPTVTVFATDFVGRYLTIQNTYGIDTKDKAVALRVTSDRAAFYACRIISYQDTLLDESGRHFYSNCYIEGATDFICGNASSLFQKCHLHSSSEDNGAITAQHRMTEEDDSGFYFVGCKITGLKTCTLGRPWGPYSRVVFSQTYMSSTVLPQGWDDWGKPDTHKTAYYGEYECYGPGANTTSRVDWSLKLSNQQAIPFITMTKMDAKAWVFA